MNGLQALVDGLGPRLRDAGLPLMRLRLGMRTTHPLVAAVSFVWEQGPPATTEVPEATAHGLEARSSFIGSPMQQISDSEGPFRRKLSQDLTQDDHIVLHELKAAGATDYYGRPLHFASGSFGIILFVANGPKGFTDADIALLDTLSDVLSPIAECHRHEYLATAIAKSYLGARTGQRVLNGQITRGNIETIDAAILFSDIRGWTALNASSDPADVLEVANSFFEVMSDAVDQNDGEILKFMGDGVLAIFPSDGTPADQQRACRQAISAARASQDIAAAAALPVPFGVGIHYGAVLYGNVGARERLDFTVMGQSVNIAARVEACCARLQHSVLVSKAVATMADLAMQHVSTENLKGLTDPMELFAPSNAPPAKI